MVTIQVTESSFLRAIRLLDEAMKPIIEYSPDELISAKKAIDVMQEKISLANGELQNAAYLYFNGKE